PSPPLTLRPHSSTNPDTADHATADRARSRRRLLDESDRIAPNLHGPRRAVGHCAGPEPVLDPPPGRATVRLGDVGQANLEAELTLVEPPLGEPPPSRSRTLASDA